MFFIGENDLAFRKDIIRGIYSFNRRARAWRAVTTGTFFLNRVQRSMADGRSPHPTLEYGG